ncbi:phosphopantetheine-binding protein [Roseovarius sp. M141]|uniref:phosphopantetheine-binding protein n=1 Tax=Roseovarius sp. M141 TaxID=2583806 RepID=UPI0020CD80F3|nr:phosphopantetheine-binding protein [Roseovarius sp. M141]MCQ0090820.1 acyl carrier protein [Roseovarius sp. M141]
MTTSSASLPDKATLWAEIRGCIDKVIPTMADVSITLETDLSSLGITSIEMITVIFEIEELYDIVIVDSGLDVFDTPDELVDIVLMLLSKKEAA